VFERLVEASKACRVIEGNTHAAPLVALVNELGADLLEHHHVRFAFALVRGGQHQEHRLGGLGGVRVLRAARDDHAFHAIFDVLTVLR
jgi:hypothetical protein